VAIDVGNSNPKKEKECLFAEINKHNAIRAYGE
jgi:hypothetical protein